MVIAYRVVAWFGKTEPNHVRHPEDPRFRQRGEGSPRLHCHAVAWEAGSLEFSSKTIYTCLTL